MYCVLVFPDSTESRWFDRLPKPGQRIRSGGGYSGSTWVVDEVLKSGKSSYTVFLTSRQARYRRRRSAGEVDLAEELLELARRTTETVEETRRRRKRRHYYP